MRYLVITGGPNIDSSCSGIANVSDLVFCADSGTDYALANDINIDKVFGDLDSISNENLELIKSKKIPIEIYPCEKDMTDTEITLRSIPMKDSKVVLLCSLKGRIDHVMANLNLLLKLHEEGLDIVATDGKTDVIPMIAGEEIIVDGLVNPENLSISIITNGCKGVNSEGLYYELNNADLGFGSTLTVSNKLLPHIEKFKLKISQGSCLVMICDSRE